MAKNKTRQKEQSNVQYSGVLPKELMDRVDAEAKKTDRSRAAQIRVAVAFFLNQSGAPSVTAKA